MFPLESPKKCKRSGGTYQYNPEGVLLFNSTREIGEILRYRFVLDEAPDQGSSFDSRKKLCSIRYSICYLDFANENTTS